MQGKSIAGLLLSFAFLTIGHSANAADMPAPMPVKASPPPVSAWTYQFTPYLWATWLDGTSTIKGRSIDVDVTFFDLLDRKIPKELLALMGSFEARKDRFSFFTDIVYAKVGASGSGVRARNVHPAIGGSLSGSIALQFKMFIAETDLTYEMFNWRGTTAGSETSLDLYGGARFWWQQAEASLALTAGLVVGDLVLSGGRAIAGSGDVTWVDALVGLRLRHRFTPTSELVLRGDVGGFGSDFSWQAMGTYTWDFARTQNAVWSGMVGYRALYVDFEKGAGNTLYQYDMLMHGPVLGMTIKF